MIREHFPQQSQHGVIRGQNVGDKPADAVRLRLACQLSQHHFANPESLELVMHGQCNLGDGWIVEPDVAGAADDSLATILLQFADRKWRRNWPRVVGFITRGPDSQRGFRRAGRPALRQARTPAATCCDGKRNKPLRPR